MLIVPRSGVRSRRDVSTRSAFTRRSEVAVPIVSASMDTVTKSAMAVALAQVGVDALVLDIPHGQDRKSVV